MNLTYVVVVKKGRRIPLHKGPFEHEIAFFLPAGTTAEEAIKKLDKIREEHHDAVEVELEKYY